MENDNISFVVQHTRLSSISLPSSTLYLLHHWVIRTQGWWMASERKSFCASSQAWMSKTRSPAAFTLLPRPLKPASNNATALQTQVEKIRSMWGSERGREGSGGRKGKQAVHADIKCTSEGRQEEAVSERRPGMSTYRREVSAGAREGGGSLRGEDELMHRGGRKKITSSSSGFNLIYVTTYKTLGTNKITVLHFGCKSQKY